MLAVSMLIFTCCLNNKPGLCSRTNTIITLPKFSFTLKYKCLLIDSSISMTNFYLHTHHKHGSYLVTNSYLMGGKYDADINYPNNNKYITIQLSRNISSLKLEKKQANRKNECVVFMHINI